MIKTNMTFVQEETWNIYVLSNYPNDYFTFNKIGVYYKICLTTKQDYKMWNVNQSLTSLFAGFGLEAAFLLGVGYTRNTTTAITCLTIAVGVSGFAISGMI